MTTEWTNPESHEIPVRLTTEELAVSLRTPVGTLRYWRSIGKGPKSYKVGRRVLYDCVDVEEWIDAQKRASVK